MLPQFQTDIQELSLLQNKWAAQLNPLLAQPMSEGQLLQNVTLSSGDTKINHKLGRTLQGWVIVRKRANANVYDKQDTNPSPALTLILNASTAVVVDLMVF